ncbi:alpha/beta fold hydrolase [Runella sp.]|uniref:alpha/beta fold hydrolase n=1 Tax=Runella sp. TaxID=1960881 RepID=UPI003D14205F
MFEKYFFITLLFFVGIVKSYMRVDYPYEVRLASLKVENQNVKMAYMDIAPSVPTGKTVVLLHGKNFNGYYWKDVISALTNKGYRVIVPDQIGWGKSDKPNVHYSFHLLAANTKALLDLLKIDKVTVLGHSMGGMLAARFSLLYPKMVEKLVLENPIGLEDYKTFVPYQPLEELVVKEKNATYDSYKKYQQSYYPIWKPEYEQYVAAQAEALTDPEFPQTAMANALTYEMIYEQPIVYELKDIAVPTLLIIGQADRTVVGKDLLTVEQKMNHGNYPALGKMANQQIKGSQLVELDGIGHIPHIQDLEQFKNALFKFL